MIEIGTNEIIALVAIIILIVIYAIIKIYNSSNKKVKNQPENSEIKEFDDTSKELESIIIEDADEIQEDVQVADEEILEIDHTLSGEEEGSFDIPESQKVQNEKNDTPKRYKIEVPSHGKIHKEDFKRFSGSRILVAEDNIINQKVIAGLFTDSGVEIVLAEDGQIALDILKNDSNFNVILMDAHMPRVDGFEASKQIRANSDYEHILIVALSGDTASDDIRKMTEAGMEEHLEKPLKMDDLYDILYAYIHDEVKKDENDDEYIVVPLTNELKIDKGLEICGGDEAFYHEILDEFVANYSQSAKDLKTMLDNSQLKQADQLLLDLCGVTSNIGADNLYALATKLKDEIKDHENRSYINTYLKYANSLQLLLKDIKTYQN